MNERPIVMCILSGATDCCDFEKCPMYPKCFPAAQETEEEK